MKKLKLQNPTYQVLLSAFTNWLDVLGYSKSARLNYPRYVQEFFYYLECHRHTDLKTIPIKMVKAYYKHLKERPNTLTNGALSKATLNQHQQALKKFNEYLKKQHHKPIPVHLKAEKPNNEVPDFLTQNEIKQLFEITEHSNTKRHLRYRDKAMLVALYSLGLRLNEAVQLDRGDILFDKELVHIRKGKNYKERAVPVNRYNLQILEDYLFDGRTEFYKSHTTEAFFIGSQGKRLGGQSMNHRLKYLIKCTHNTNLQAKKITAHKLRHSIATHLLQQGAPIENIQQFLGHVSLETTQVYVHLAKQNQ